MLLRVWFCLFVCFLLNVFYEIWGGLCLGLSENNFSCGRVAAGSQPPQNLTTALQYWSHRFSDTEVILVPFWLFERVVTPTLVGFYWSGTLAGASDEICLIPVLNIMILTQCSRGSSDTFRQGCYLCCEQTLARLVFTVKQWGETWWFRLLLAPPTVLTRGQMTFAYQRCLKWNAVHFSSSYLMEGNVLRLSSCWSVTGRWEVLLNSTHQSHSVPLRCRVVVVETYLALMF